jgi:hypothetical protein
MKLPASRGRKRSLSGRDQVQEWFCELMEADAFLYDELADSLEATLPQLHGAERSEVEARIRDRRRQAHESREWLRLARNGKD